MKSLVSLFYYTAGAKPLYTGADAGWNVAGTKVYCCAVCETFYVFPTTGVGFIGMGFKGTTFEAFFYSFSLYSFSLSLSKSNMSSSTLSDVSLSTSVLIFFEGGFSYYPMSYFSCMF